MSESRPISSRAGLSGAGLWSASLSLGLSLGVAVVLCLAAGCSKSSSSFADPSADPNAGVGGSAGTLNCGNGDIDPDEDCEPGNLDGKTCESLRFEGGMLGCDPRTCTFDTSMCRGEQAPVGGSSG